MIVPYDTDGRQSAVDFLLEWPDGRTEALEITRVTEPESIVWQGMAMRESWRWPAATSWDFRPAEVSFPYKHTRRAVLKAVELCDEWSVDDPADLPSAVVQAEPDIAVYLAEGVGSLCRAASGTGVNLYPKYPRRVRRGRTARLLPVGGNRAQAAPLDAHFDKLIQVPPGREKHLFLVPTDDVLPARFFTDDFEAPVTSPQGFEALDGLWVWSNFWHRYLVFRDQTWSWVTFPARQ
ncbi:hypothetical protein GCM10011492_09960 [Flexivirga endophytica]|jgi:hypothetical protein|uniref:Uncharacterized protein n=2 Tax=Flexivirga endophytica TaxID=1849103 RepID=A0A916T0D9_9MICO|nr:hypothetical protein GCM10011492_09960 [Flexivirga endophytica]GHB59657.1 hypothetical protein GCM10008112_30980 [Flexivirga endophytica]